MKTPALILFAKHPIEGKVKTRLQPECSPKLAAELAAYAIQATVELAAANWPGEVLLYGWPDDDYPLYRELAQQYHIHLGVQVPGDLGQKMAQALRDGIAAKGAAAVMGCDVPHCSGAIMEQAFEALARKRNVIGATLDGGYYLIGLQQVHERLFDGIAWGSKQVMQQTQERARELDLEFELLPPLRDIDTWEDLWLVSKIYAPLRRFVDACDGKQST